MTDAMDDPDRVREILAQRYDVQRLLGRGGTASVYLAIDNRLRRRVAIKVLRSDIASLVGAERFAREIELTARLQHPHILGVIESGSEQGLLYYVLPFVEGESLHDRLQRSRQLGVDDAVRITCEVADALAYAHSKGVIHRDIKPENILLSENHAIVTDFGLARALADGSGGRLTESGMTMGTPFYMSPEQAAGDRQIDGRADQYALACVLYEMLAGEPPFSGATPQMVLARQVTQRPPSIRVVRQGVTRELEAVIEQGLAKSPADRYTGVGDFAAALRTALAGAPLPPRRKRLVTTLMGTGVIVFCLWLLAREQATRRQLDVAIPSPHIAVLAFDAPDGSASLQSLAAGVTTRLTDGLSTTKTLTVVSRRAVAAYDAVAVTLDSLARLLHVGTLIDGSMMESVGGLRVALRLLDDSGRQIAGATIHMSRVSGAYPVDLLADSVTRAVRRLLGPMLEFRREQLASHSAVAFSEVQAAAERLTTFQMQMNGEDLSAAERSLHDADSMFAAADHLDPGWVEPILGRARSKYLHTQLAAAKAVPPDPWLRDAVAYAAQAVSRQPTSSEAREVLGTMEFQLSSKGHMDSDGSKRLRERAEAELRAALSGASDPSDVLRRLSEVVAAGGRTSEAIGLADSAYLTDPYLANAQQLILRLFEYNFELGRDSAAAIWCATGRRRFPGEASLHECGLQLMAWSDRIAPNVATARRTADSALRLVPTFMTPLLAPRLSLLVGLVEIRAGHPDSARAIVTRVLSDTVRNLGIVVPAADIYVLLGQPSDARRLLAQFVTSHPVAALQVRRSPEFRILAKDHEIAAAMAGSPIR